MLSCYIARKLYESKKITDDKFHVLVDVKIQPNKGKKVDHRNRLDLEKLYELEKFANDKKKFSFVANQIIHSFVFIPIFDRQGYLSEVAFNSDFTKEENLFRVKVVDLIKIFSKISDSYIYEVSYFYQENGNLVIKMKDSKD